MKNNKIPFEVEYRENSEQKYIVEHINGKRIQIETEKEVLVDPIVKDVYKRSQKLLREANRGFEIEDGKIREH